MVRNLTGTIAEYKQLSLLQPGNNALTLNKTKILKDKHKRLTQLYILTCLIWFQLGCIWFQLGGFNWAV